MRIPPALSKGDKIGVISTARIIPMEDLEPALQDLRKWGYEPVLGEHLFETDHQYAGTDEQRAEDLQSMLDDPDIKAILCARGGYGTLRIIDQVDLKNLRRDPKWIIGFSDVTTLTMAAYNLGVASIHGPMAISWNGASGNAQSREYLREILAGKRPTYEFQPDRLDLLQPGEASGRLIGGNLSMLSQLLGTPTDFDSQGCILFLEDLDEYLYHIDRMIVHLKRGGKFDKIEALMIGGMTSMHDNSTPFGKSAEEIIAEAVEDRDIPLVFGAPVGHWPRNYPLIHGAEAVLTVTEEKAILKFEE